MAITLITRDYDNNINLESELFVGRVLKVEQVTETRNWSDTMDYTDFRSTQCTYALVWLGTRGIAPEYNDTARPRVHRGSLLRAYEALPDYLADKVRDLEYFEQFAWVDCTNLHSDRMASRLVNPIVDAVPYTSDEPLMWANFIAWEAYMKALGEKKLRDQEEARLVREKAEAEKEAKAQARAAKREAKDIEGKLAAEALLSLIPAKGTEVTIQGFTGVVFWKGTTKHRRVWSARAGVRNPKGEVVWVDSSVFAV